MKNRKFSPEEVMKILQNVFYCGELVGFLDSVGMHECVPTEVRAMAEKRVKELRKAIGECFEK